MRLLILLAPIALLAACGHDTTGLAPAVQVPVAPSVLTQRAERLKPNTDTSVQGQVLDNTNSITMYNRVASQLNAFIDYFDCVRIAVNNKKDLNCQK